MPEKKITVEYVSDDIQEKFRNGIAQTELERFITFEFISSPKLKTVTKIETPTEKSTLRQITGVEVYFHINEELFDGLNERMQEIVIAETLTEIVWDNEADKLTKVTKDVNTFQGVVRKYGDEYLDLLGAIKDLQDQIKEKEKEAKANAKGNDIK